MKRIISSVRMLLFLGLFLAACKEEAVQVNQNQIIQLTAENDISTLKADGISVINLKAVIPANALAASRTVTFSATSGLGAFTGSAANNTNIVTADQDGVAKTSIIVSKIPGTYYVSAQVSAGGQNYRTADLQVISSPLSATDKLVLKTDNTQPAADGFTTMNISITAKYRADKAVKLTASLGSFPQSSDQKNITVNLDDQGSGSTVFQISNQLASHIITGTFITEGSTVSVTINPVISRPDSIILESTANHFDTVGTAVPLSTYLRKTVLNSKVSQGIPVNFVAYQMISGVKKNVGRFVGANNAVSDLNGVVPVVNFYADKGDADIKQDIIIEASVLKTPAAYQTVQLRLKVKPK